MITVLLALAAQAPVTTYWNTAPAKQAAPQATIQPAPLATTAQPAPLAVAPPVTANAMLRIGTEVPLRLEEELTTNHKQLRVGQRFHLTTSEPVLLNGLTVIPVGTPAEGEITEVRNKGMWGKSGHLAGRPLYMTVNGRQIILTGTFDDKGTAGGWGAAAVSAFVFLPAGFFMTGTSAKVPAGTIVKSFVGEDVPLAMPVVAQAPLQVAMPATPMPVQAVAPVPAQPVQLISAKAVAPIAQAKPK
jgi:hypothetical protein